MTALPNDSAELNWLLDDLVKRVPRTRHAIVLSSDGLLIGHSGAMERDDAEHMSAVASAFQSLARGAGRHFGGGRVRQTIVELEKVYLFVTGAGRGACLAVLGEADIDVGLVAYEMNLIVKRVGDVLSAAPRHGATAAQPF